MREIARISHAAEAERDMQAASCLFFSGLCRIFAGPGAARRFICWFKY